MPKKEDRKLTAKENYVRVLRGEMPEWVPINNMSEVMPYGEDASLAWVSPDVLNPNPWGGPDIWGVNWVAGSDAAGGGTMPEPGNYLLEDVCDWQDVVKAPDVSDVDWEDMCKKSLAAWPFDFSKTAVGLYLDIGIFQELVGLMGYEGALIAMLEEPGECGELCKYMNDFYVEVGKKCMPYLKPDLVVIVDDTCSEKGPVMSDELWEQILLPCYKHESDELAVPYGIPVQFHLCGIAAERIEKLHDEAHVTGWEPASMVNDLVAFKEKWGREIALLGAFDDRAFDNLDPDLPQDEVDDMIRQAVRDSYDTYAPDGGYAFFGYMVGPQDDPQVRHKSDVMMKEAIEYGNCFYD